MTLDLGSLATLNIEESPVCADHQLGSRRRFHAVLNSVLKYARPWRHISAMENAAAEEE